MLLVTKGKNYTNVRLIIFNKLTWYYEEQAGPNPDLEKDPNQWEVLTCPYPGSPKLTDPSVSGSGPLGKPLEVILVSVNYSFTAFLAKPPSAFLCLALPQYCFIALNFFFHCLVVFLVLFFRVSVLAASTSFLVLPPNLPFLYLFSPQGLGISVW